MEAYINLIVLEPALILQERGVYRPNQQLTPGVNRGQVASLWTQRENLLDSRRNSSRSRYAAVTIRSIRKKAFWL
jgi:hypothetical protein